MATTADFKNGLYLNYNGKPCQIVWFQHVKPGKGPAFVKTKLRNLENGRILENTFTAGAKIDTINVEKDHISSFTRMRTDSTSCTRRLMSRSTSTQHSLTTLTS